MKNDFLRMYISLEIRRRMIELAREFRKEPTKGEKVLWQALRGKKLDGHKFRRQQPIGYFVVNFYNSVHRLVVEVDGSIHEFQKEADYARQEILQELGLVVLRINTELVENNLSKALELIREQIRIIRRTNQQSIPSPSLGEGQGGGN